MELISVVVWFILICGIAGLCLWAVTYAPAPFQRPIRIVIFVVAGIFLVYLIGGVLVKLAPPFPGLILSVFGL